MLVRKTSVFILIQISFFPILTLMKGERGVSVFITTVTAEMCIKLEMCRCWGFNNNSDSYGTTTDMSVSSLCLTSASINPNQMLAHQVHSKAYELKTNTFVKHLLLRTDTYKYGCSHKKLSFPDQAVLTFR